MAFLTGGVPLLAAGGEKAGAVFAVPPDVLARPLRDDAFPISPPAPLVPETPEEEVAAMTLRATSVVGATVSTSEGDGAHGRSWWAAVSARIGMRWNTEGRLPVPDVGRLGRTDGSLLPRLTSAALLVAGNGGFFGATVAFAAATDSLPVPAAGLSCPVVSFYFPLSRASEARVAPVAEGRAGFSLVRAGGSFVSCLSRLVTAAAAAAAAAE